MFDNNTRVSTSYSQEVSFNSVSGTLVKSCSDSKFTRFHMNSERAKCVFNPDRPALYEKEWNEPTPPEIEVLQVMLCGGDQFLVEFRYKDKGATNDEE